jgi:hypothetical protein
MKKSICTLLGLAALTISQANAQFGPPDPLIRANDGPSLPAAPDTGTTLVLLTFATVAVFALHRRFSRAS